MSLSFVAGRSREAARPGRVSDDRFRGVLEKVADSDRAWLVL
jgi:hypothetical protein